MRGLGAIILRTGLFTPAWSQKDSERVLDILLEALTQIDALYLAHNPHTPRLYESGVRYYHDGIRREWFTVDEALREKVADCKTLSAWLAAEYRVLGIDTGAKCARKMAVVDDPTVGRLLLYHVVVQRGDGTIEDPSRKLGMGGAEPDGYIPVPGVEWRVLNAMTHTVGAGMMGDQFAVEQLRVLRERADAGDARARYLVELAKELRSRGYDPRRNEWVRRSDKSWDWDYPGAGPVPSQGGDE